MKSYEELFSVEELKQVKQSFQVEDSRVVGTQNF